MKKFYQANNKVFLFFYIGKEQFAVPVEHVIEVIRGAGLTAVPRTEEYIEGIINFRGDIVTVVNTYKKLNLPHNINTVEEQVIIVFELDFNNSIVRIGALADKVKKVKEVSEDEIQPVPDFGSYFNPEYLDGAIHTAEGFIMVLDIKKILSEKEVELIVEVSAEQKRLN